MQYLRLATTLFALGAVSASSALVLAVAQRVPSGSDLTTIRGGTEYEDTECTYAAGSPETHPCACEPGKAFGCAVADDNWDIFDGCYEQSGFTCNDAPNTHCGKKTVCNPPCDDPDRMCTVQENWCPTGSPNGMYYVKCP